MSRQARYEERRREAGNKTVSARLNAEQVETIKAAGGPTSVLREQAAILAAIERNGAKAVHDAAFARMNGDLGALLQLGIDAPSLATAYRASVAAYQLLSPAEQTSDLAEAEAALAKIASD